ncbi:MAG: phosphatase PAP2 family protein [Vescimonas sp.]
MDILYALEKIRTPFWNGVMSAVTQLGGEVIFIVAAVVVFWCVSKWEGYYLMTIAFCGTVLNQFLKLICRVPRPWVRDPNFTIVESARAEATGYSFPSGHTQNAIGLFGGMARWGGRRWVRLGLTTLALVIAFSRMYLGVHTPADVGVSLVLAAALVLGLYPLMRRAQEKPRYMGYVLARHAGGQRGLCGVRRDLRLSGGYGCGESGQRHRQCMEDAGRCGGYDVGLAAGSAVYSFRDAGRLVGAGDQGGCGHGAAAGHQERPEGSAAGAIGP